MSAATDKATFEHYAALEPRLRTITAIAMASGLSCTDGIDWQMWEDVKRQIKFLVGWNRRGGPEELRTTDAYEVVYRHLFQVFETAVAG